jgi:hypothetical protein
MLTKAILYVIFFLVIQGISYLITCIKITRKGKLLERVGRKASGLNLEKRYGSWAAEVNQQNKPYSFNESRVFCWSVLK